MRSSIQASNEDELMDYENLRAANMKRNAMVLSALGLPGIDSMQKSKKRVEKGKELAEKRNKMKGHEVFLKEKTVNIIEAVAVEEYEAPSGMKDLCWSCKVKLGSPNSLFYGQCGRRQGGPKVQMAPLRCSVQRKSENKVEPEDHKEEVDSSVQRKSENKVEPKDHKEEVDDADVKLMTSSWQNWNNEFIC